MYVVNSLSPTAFNFSKCELLETWRVNAVRDWIYATVNMKEINLGTVKLSGEELLGFHLDVDTLKRNPTMTTRTRSLLSLGSPLKGYVDSKDREQEQKDKYKLFFTPLEKTLWKKFGMESRIFFSPYRTKAETDDMDVEWFAWAMMSQEFSRILGEDFLAPIASVVVVITWILVHTGSVFVRGLGMLQILLSIPFSFAFYKFVLGIPFFSQMHILTIFLVLGVGADDVFVLNDAWKQSFAAFPKKDGEDESELLKKRMYYAYKRTASAVFNTSFTTAMAFVSTGISPMMSISTFGWFATIAIAVNYLFVISFTPAALIVSELYINPFFSKLCSRKGKREEDVEGRNAPEDQQKPKGLVERFFENFYAPMVLKRVKPGSNQKYVAVILVAIFGGYAIQGIYFTGQLTPPTKAEQWFPLDHMMTGITDRMSDNYLGGSDDGYLTMSWVFGISGVDREADNYDMYKPDENRGIAQFDDNLNIYPEANQMAFVDLCDFIETLQCKDEKNPGKYLEACADQTTHRLARAGTLVCFMKEFRQWHYYRHGLYPTSSHGVSEIQFLDRLKTFRKTTTPGNETTKSWKSTIGFIGGKLKFLRIPFTSTMVRLKPVLVKEPLYDYLEKAVEEKKKELPKGLKTIFQEGGYYGWVWMITQRQLVTSMMTGMAICFPIALGVLLIATGNILVSIYATCSIGCIVCCVLGFTRLVMDWDLGIAESIAGIIVIGFSVDYVVHLAHMYMDALHKGGLTGREERF